MAFKLLARTRETTATTGTGAIVLSGPTTQCDAFSDGLANGDTTFAMVVSDDGTAWEEGFYTYVSSGNELTRTAIIRNNTGGTSAINLAGGRVFGMIPADFPLLFDKLFSATRGSIIRRGSAAWEALAPGSINQILTMGANDPAWAGAARGPFPVSALPTAAGTGLSTWLNQGTATVADTASGILIDAASAAAFSLKGRTKTAPATPYTVTALVGILGSANGSYAGLGWYDGTNKLHIVGPNVFSGAWSILSGKLNTPTSYSANDTALAWVTAPFPPLLWMQISDDGTNVTFRYGIDGTNFLVLNTIAKASGWLGASGYTNLVFFGVPQNGAIKATLLSYAET